MKLPCAKDLLIVRLNSPFEVNRKQKATSLTIYLCFLLLVHVSNFRCPTLTVFSSVRPPVISPSSHLGGLSVPPSHSVYLTLAVCPSHCHIPFISPWRSVRPSVTFRSYHHGSLSFCPSIRPPVAFAHLTLAVISAALASHSPTSVSMATMAFSIVPDISERKG